MNRKMNIPMTYEPTLRKTLKVRLEHNKALIRKLQAQNFEIEHLLEGENLKSWIKP